MEAAKRLEEVKSKHINNSAIQSSTDSLVKIKDDTMDSVSQLVEKIRSASSDLAKDAVDFVRRNPFQTAIGALVVGFAAGMLIRRRK